jgi:hypothetical protein
MLSTKISRFLAAAARNRSNEKGVDHEWYSYEKRIEDEEEDFFEFGRTNKSLVKKRVGLVKIKE